MSAAGAAARNRYAGFVKSQNQLDGLAFLACKSKANMSRQAAIAMTNEISIV